MSKQKTLLSDPPLCACGCGDPVTRAKSPRLKHHQTHWNKYILGHSARKAGIRTLMSRVLTGPPPKCACGCGRFVTQSTDSQTAPHWNHYYGKHGPREAVRHIYPYADNAPFCACGCGHVVTHSKKNPNKWNRYYSRHGSSVNRAKFQPPPKCACGCGHPVQWGWNRWHKYADVCAPLLRDLASRVREPLATKHELCAHLKITERTLERRVARGRLPKPLRFKKPGHSQLFVAWTRKSLVMYGVYARSGKRPRLARR